MTTRTDSNRDPSVPPEDAPPRGGKAKAIPPLVWVILALLVLMAVLAMAQCDGNHRTIGGGDTPMKNPAQEQQTIMPATPPPAERPDAQPTPQTRTATPQQ